MTYLTPVSVPGARREFHVARAARDTYNFDDTLFSLAGHVLFADVRAARALALRINTVRRAAVHPDRAVRAGDVYAMGLIDEVFHYVITLYLEQYGRSLMRELIELLHVRLGKAAFQRLVETFADRFPTVAHYHGRETVDESVNRTVDGIPGQEILVEEMLVMWIGNRNPAFAPMIELFDEQILAIDTVWAQATSVMHEFFGRQPAFGPEDQTLVELLRAPAITHPYDLTSQLEYIRSRWGSMIGSFLDRLLRSLDLITEEQRARFHGPGEAHVPTYAEDEADYARYSPDRDWMPQVILLAKSTLVWLDQLSRQYGREIRTLDLVPDEELDRLAEAGFTGLWLIGLWQRSSASRRIKNLCGNPEAEASAYSLYDYEVADELGGWEAVDSLRRRLWQRGVRLASDMVPNHSGIDSRWVHEHPDWFIGLDHPPFPGYAFNGENLSTNPGVGIYLEDHYYDRTDAAVVFKRVDFGSGQSRFIYHGNDGTSMPWNDTAQLDYLKAEVREAIIQTILHVARNFPIIRFDAAMTLAKKHVQRLWYPSPGHGGDIPSRSEHGLSQADFDALIPQEFWREVVDRVAAEVPDTLLLAEAFWMMESYFVRNLGMHRVYNSAFMHMLKNEDNEKYRQTIKNTLEYDPEILKRFVNFMNNPDEDTAVAQFGNGDKYFGVTTLMITMPGLPMFGHGQIEGYAEKYGMEYRRAYWDEQPSAELVERHRNEVFPLMHRRRLFAEARNFRLFDLYNAESNVETNVFAYANRDGEDRALVLYNNSFYRANGWIHTSTPFIEPDGSTRSERLIDALGFTSQWNRFAIFREHRSGLWYIRNCGEIAERGLYASLDGYQAHVFLDWYEVTDNEYAHYARLADHLAGGGTPDVTRSLKRLLLQPLHDAFMVICNSGVTRTLYEALLPGGTPVDWSSIGERYRGFLAIAGEFSDHHTQTEDAHAMFVGHGQALERLSSLATRPGIGPVGAVLKGHLEAEREDVTVFLALTVLVPLDEFLSGTEHTPRSMAGFIALDQASEWQLLDTARPVLAALTDDGELPWYWEQLVSVLLAHHRWLDGVREIMDTDPRAAALAALETLTADAAVESFLQIHTHGGVTWYNREAFELLIDWLTVVAVWGELREAISAGAARISWKPLEKSTQAVGAIYKGWRTAEATSEYQVQRLLAALADPAPPAPKRTVAGTPTEGSGTPTAAPTSAGTRASRKKTKG